MQPRRENPFVMCIAWNTQCLSLNFPFLYLEARMFQCHWDARTLNRFGFKVVLEYLWEIISLTQRTIHGILKKCDFILTAERDKSEYAIMFCWLDAKLGWNSLHHWYWCAKCLNILCLLTNFHGVVGWLVAAIVVGFQSHFLWGKTTNIL